MKNDPAFPVKNFKKIPGFKCYYINKNGDVYSTFKKGFMKPMHTRGRPQLDLYRYNSNIRKKTGIGRLVLLTWVRPPRKNEQAAHLDNNPNNNHISNLKWCLPLENMAHQLIHGTRMRGESHWASKLTVNDVNFIRKNYKKDHPKFNSTLLGEMFGVNRRQIIKIVRASKWSHVK